ncbi:MAG TPA: circularly permuted type 2 ATP-grasp protein [Capillimicrobium sp.]|nr:circularly permuted type 2 ATP-grasp protein [Capillimicrobium sp.]
MPTDAYDEAYDDDGEPRPHYAAVVAALEEQDLEELSERVRRFAADHGATFGHGRVFAVDPVPRLLTAAEWADLEDGLGQRVRALDAFVRDVASGEQRIVAAGVLPERLARSLPFREDDLAGAPEPPGARVAIAGLDVVRDRSGRFRVLEDNVRTPSGLAYVLAARGAVERELGEAGEPRPLRAAIAEQLRRVLDAARPRPASDDAVVVLTDGPANDAFFEHGVLAELAGVELVTPADVRADGDRLRLRASGREIQVVYRRTDADAIRGPDGAPTPIGELLLDPVRAGRIAVVNAFGTGVADDKRIYPYVDAMVRFYLGEEPRLPSVPTYDLEDRAARDEALARLDELVLKPRDGFGGHGVLIGATATDGELRRAAERIVRDPGRWCAQERVLLSTHPTAIGGRLVPRHVDLRPFVFFDGETATAIPGGLTRVALEEGSLVVNSSAGGGGKDTWVLR